MEEGVEAEEEQEEGQEEEAWTVVSERGCTTDYS
jgi:hypothetical protein